MIPAEHFALALKDRVLLLFLLAVALAVFGLRTYRRVRLISLGKGKLEIPAGGFAARARQWVLQVFGQQCNTRNITSEDLAGVEHLFIFWGAVALSVYYLVFVIIGDGLGAAAFIRASVISKAFLNLSDLAAVLMAAGFCWGAARRNLVKPARLGPHFEGKLFLMIAVAACAVSLGYLTLEALRLNLQMSPSAGLLSSLLALIFRAAQIEPAKQVGLYRAVWLAQSYLLAGFLIYTAFSRHQHVLFCPFNIFLKLFGPKGGLSAVELDGSYSGASRPQDFERRELLDLYACTHCGRCQDVCPAHRTGKPLSPKKVILDLGLYLEERSNPLREWCSLGVSEDEIWACTTCMACSQACPVMVEHVGKVVDLRRDLVLMKSKFPSELLKIYRNLETFGDPLGMGSFSRTDWGRSVRVEHFSKAANVEVLLWVGCAGAFYDRNTEVSIALVHLLDAAGVSYATLGKDEKCCGDSARRLGNEYLFQSLAMENIETLQKYGVKRIVTPCPHCLNTLGNEYRQFGGEFEVVHHSQYIAELIEQGRLDLKRPLGGTVTYQDPCYLGRYSGIYDAPRKVLEAIPEARIIEMGENREKSFCCGGGGGRIWMRESIGERINEVRAETAMRTNADTIATSCPFCLTMLEEGVKSKTETGLPVRVADIAELLAQAI